MVEFGNRELHANFSLTRRRAPVAARGLPFDIPRTGLALCSHRGKSPWYWRPMEGEPARSIISFRGKERYFLDYERRGAIGFETGFVYRTIGNGDACCRAGIRVGGDRGKLGDHRRVG